MDFTGVEIRKFQLGSSWQHIAQEVWVKYDTNNDLTISMNVFPSMVRDLASRTGSAEPKQEECWHLMQKFDEDKNGICSYDEFICM